MKITPEYEDFDDNGAPMVMWLLNYLNRPRQSPNHQWDTADKHLAEVGFKILKADLCAYISSKGGDIYADIVRRLRCADEERYRNTGKNHAKTDGMLLDDRHGRHVDARDRSSWVPAHTVERVMSLLKHNTRFDFVPVYTDNTSNIHVACDRTYSS